MSVAGSAELLRSGDGLCVGQGGHLDTDTGMRTLPLLPHTRSCACCPCVCCRRFPAHIAPHLAAGSLPLGPGLDPGSCVSGSHTNSCGRQPPSVPFDKHLKSAARCWARLRSGVGVASIVFDRPCGCQVLPGSFHGCYMSPCTCTQRNSMTTENHQTQDKTHSLDTQRWDPVTQTP